jgi:hypothetical protein
MQFALSIIQERNGQDAATAQYWQARESLLHPGDERNVAPITLGPSEWADWY